MLCFLQTPVLRFVLLPYYRRNHDYLRDDKLFDSTLILMTVLIEFSNELVCPTTSLGQRILNSYKISYFSIQTAS